MRCDPGLWAAHSHGRGAAAASRCLSSALVYERGAATGAVRVLCVGSAVSGQHETASIGGLVGGGTGATQPGAAPGWVSTVGWAALSAVCALVRIRIGEVRHAGQ